MTATLERRLMLVRHHIGAPSGTRTPNPRETLTNKTLTAPALNSPVITTPTYSGDFVGATRYIVKTVDQSLASTISPLQSDTALTFSTAANAVYYGHAMVNATGPGNIKYALGLPAGGCTVSVEINPNGVGTGYSLFGYGSDTVFYTSAGTDSDVSLHFRIVTFATAGSATLRWAQATSNATPTLVKAGSFFVVTRVA